MATSGTNTFSVTRDEIIDAALRVLLVIGAGETPTSEDYTNCSEALNIMIKSWAKDSIPLWVYQQIELSMLEDLGIYPVGPTAGYIYSVTLSDGGSGYPDSGTVTFTGGGGTGATGTYAATDGEITSVTITSGGNSYTSAPTVSFSGAGTGATGTANVAGKTMSKPLRIIDAFIRDSNDNDTSLILISQQEYDILGNKSSSGTPNQIYYDNQLINGQVYVYNVPADSTHTVFLTAQRMFEDMSASDDTFDFPQEWYQALKWGLANELSEEYEVPETKIMRIQQRAENYLMKCMDFSQEEAGIFFTPNKEGTLRKW